jgi:2-dehydropantoate 2-reductase
MSQDTAKPPSVVVVGAGLIGSFVGGLLAAGGADVAFLLRPGSTAGHAGFDALAAAPFKQAASPVPISRLTFTDDPSIPETADLVLVCVKSSATIDAASPLRGRLRAGTPVVSLQNGMENAGRLRQALPDANVLAGLVAFNVVSDGPGAYRQTTTGGIYVEDGAPAAVDILRRTGLEVTSAVDIVALQWGKLLINLNNALVALADSTLQDELGDRAWRMILVRQVDEALAAMRASGIEPRLPGPQMKLVLAILKLPDFAYRFASKFSVGVDADARSSMWEDMAHGRPTEIDDLQGAIVRLAERAGRTAPLNARVMALVKGVETGRVKRPLRPRDVTDGAYSAA